MKILLQLDTDVLPSTFDRIVAVDSGVDHVYSYGGLRADIVQGIVHGAIFTRGAEELKNTAILLKTFELPRVASKAIRGMSQSASQTDELLRALATVGRAWSGNCSPSKLSTTGSPPLWLGPCPPLP